jgi:hypothetical protein
VGAQTKQFEIMLQSDKDALHADVIANTAHKIEKVAQELSSLYKDSFINNERIELRKNHLVKYFNELNELMQSL